MADCIFCAVRDGDSAAWMVHEDEHLLAFMDNRPLFEGHVLVVPRAHTTDLLTCDPALAAELINAAQLVARAVKAAMEADGVFMAVNNTVSQSVPHLHLHVVPRRFKDGLRGFMWPRKKYDGDEHASAVAERIRDAIHSERRRPDAQE